MKFPQSLSDEVSMGAVVEQAIPPVGQARLLSRLFGAHALYLMILMISPFIISADFHTGQIVCDPDIWWHLHNAQQLVSSHHVIRSDAYSYTVQGRPWINPETGAELPYYFAYKAWGLRGIYLVSLAATELVLLGTFALAWVRTRNLKAAFAVSIFSVLMLLASFGPRTILFGWLFFIAELLILELHQQGRDHLWLVPLLFVAWINVHASFMIGAVFLALYIGAGMFEGEWGRLYAHRWSPGQQRKLLLIGAISAAALFFNPYGWRLVVYPFDVALHQPLTTKFIGDWRGIDFHELRSQIALGLLVLMFLLTLVRSRRWPLHDFLWWGLAFYAAFTHGRFLVMIGIVICPMLATDLRFAHHDPERVRPILNAASIFVGLACIAFLTPSAAQIRAALAEKYPVAAAAWFRTNAPSGRVLSKMEWSGYLNFVDPAIPVFMDGRNDIFEHSGALADYLKLTTMDDSLSLLDRYNIQYALFPQSAQIIYLLKQTGRWHLAYQDPTAVVFARNEPTKNP